MQRRIIFPQHEADMTNWYWFPQGFSIDEIEQVHQLAQRFEYQDAVTFGSDKAINEIRKSQVKWIDQNFPGAEWLYDKVMNLAMIANRELWQFNLRSLVDSIQYTEYREGG